MNKKITNFALNPDENTIEQFNSCCRENFVLSASLMPDAHSGYVAPIGSVLVTQDVVVPAWVGYDIGCGMIACRIEEKNLVEKIREKKQEIFERVKEVVPMGVGKIGVHGDVSQDVRTKFRDLLEDFKKNEYNKDIFKFLNTQAEAHLGSLGSGNHFMELGFQEDNDDVVWLVVHSGSRGVGRHVATHYMREAVSGDSNYEKTGALLVNSREGREYLNVLEFSQEFALLNRLEIANRVIGVVNRVIDKNLDFELWTNKNHNMATKDNRFSNLVDNGSSEIFIHRKGATPAEGGERGVIPANMRDGCFLVEGLGNFDFLYSSSHGAGRVMSRREAKRKSTLSDFEKTMKGVVGKVDEETLDEAPFAYKNIYDVMEYQRESVKNIGHIKPIINWKG